ncbi:hypothetical protein AVEN_73761-1 [Araneus ventricosus]|uniref:Uncharacterized protein n=1 Tax=Araneus ventricosus TaxID=182803 RepID=A0A4Y2WQR8_ARAVE|nr:hypothetical protein AVEN_50377-1 [Araneus ventricosus]GBO39079.1 hypothetical protein AVEN_73761-1 [Araneus ventricosus]
MDLVILNSGQMTRTVSETASNSVNLDASNRMVIAQKFDFEGSGSFLSRDRYGKESIDGYANRESGCREIKVRVAEKKLLDGGDFIDPIVKRFSLSSSDPL